MGVSGLLATRAGTGAPASTSGVCGPDGMLAGQARGQGFPQRFPLTSGPHYELDFPPGLC